MRCRWQAVIVGTAVGLMLAVCVTSGRAADWPQWRYDAQRSARSPDPLPERLALSWQRALPRPRPAWPASQPSLRFDGSYSPVAAAGMLFVPSMVEDSLCALDGRTGRLVWRYVADGPVRLAPVYDEGRVYFACDDGRLYCLEARTGRLLWRFDGAPRRRWVLGNNRLISTWPMRGGPVLADGVIYCANGTWSFMGVFIHAVDARSGRRLWTDGRESFRYQLQPHARAYAFGSFVPRGHLAVEGEHLIVPGGRTPPARYDRRTGRLAEFNYAKKGGRDQHGPVPITAGRRTFTAQGAVVTCSDGWSARVDGPVWTMLAADRRLYVVTTTGRLYCFADARLPRPDAPGQRREPAGQAAPVKPSGLDRSGWTAWLKGRQEIEQQIEQAGPRGDFVSPEAGYGVLVGLPRRPPVDLPARAGVRGPMRWLVLDEDAGKVDRLRRLAIAAGRYGEGFAAYAGRLQSMGLPPYLAQCVVVTEAGLKQSGRSEAFYRALFEVLRPYGGRALLPVEPDELAGQAESLGLAGAKVEPAGEGWSLLIRAGALPGAADWTHQYADAANSVVSQDRRVRAPLGLLWFGNGPSNDQVLPRHGHGPSPQVAGGRLVIEGPDMLRAVDIYTGRLLWQRQLPGLGRFYDNTSHQPGAGEIGSNYVTLADAVYVVHDDGVLVLEAGTGRTVARYACPQSDRLGYLGVLGDALVVGAEPVTVDQRGMQPARYASASRRLVVLDRHTGQVRWQRDARYSFRHNNIALADGKVFCIDGLSQAKQQWLRRRGQLEPNYRPRLMALALDSGRVVWETGENVFGTFLNYSTEHGLLLQAGSAAVDRAKDEADRGMVVYRGSDGQVVWQELDRRFSGPCMLHGRTIITQSEAYDLLTGRPRLRTDPLTGRTVPWTYQRTYGCNTVIGSCHLLTFRSGAAGFYDLAGDGGTGNLGGFKSGCTSNLIVAGGLLNAPEYTRTCTCNYPNQTSLALVHDLQVETWTFNALEWDGRPIVRLGINFAAPGDRRDEQGTLWLDWPSVGGPSPDPPLRLEGTDIQGLYRHSAWLAGPGSDKWDCPVWVAGSALTGVKKIELTLARRDAVERRYAVKLVFIEPDESVGPGQRLFDVQLQGRAVARSVDVRRQTGGVWRPLVCRFDAVPVTDRLEIDLVGRSGRGPVVCGLEVQAVEP